MRTLAKEVAQQASEALAARNARGYAFPFHSVTAAMLGTQRMSTRHEGVSELLGVIIGMNIAKDSRPRDIYDVMNALHGLNGKRFDDDKGKVRATRRLVSIATQAVELCPSDPSAYNQSELIKAMGFLRGMINGERIVAEDTASLSNLLRATIPALVASPSVVIVPHIADVANLVSGLRFLSSNDVSKFFRVVKSHVRSGSGVLDESALLRFLSGFESKSPEDKATQSLFEAIVARYQEDSSSTLHQAVQKDVPSVDSAPAKNAERSVSSFADALAGIGGISFSSPQSSFILQFLLQYSRSLKEEIKSAAEVTEGSHLSVTGGVSHSSFVLAIKGLRSFANNADSLDVDSVAAVSEILGFLFDIGSIQNDPLHPLASAAVLASFRGLIGRLYGEETDKVSDDLVESLCRICERSERYIIGLRESHVPSKIDKGSDLEIAVKRPDVTNSDLRLLREIINLLLFDYAVSTSRSAHKFNKLKVKLDILLRSMSLSENEIDTAEATSRERYLRLPLTHAEAGHVKARRHFARNLDAAFRRKGANISVVKANPNIGGVYFTDIILCASSNANAAPNDLKEMLHPALFSKKNSGENVTNIVLNIEAPEAVYSMPNFVDFVFWESEKQKFILNLIKNYSMKLSDSSTQGTSSNHSRPYLAINVRSRNFMDAKIDAVASNILSSLESEK